MKYVLLSLIPWMLYPFALQYLRTGEINHYQLVAMGGVVVAMGPRLLALWTRLAVPRWFQDGWLILWILGVTIWGFRNRTICWRPGFTWAQNPITSVERLAASVAVAMLLGIPVLEFLRVL